MSEPEAPGDPVATSASQGPPDSREAQRSRRPSAAAVSAGAAVVATLVAVVALVGNYSSDALDRVHVRVISEPMVDDVWIVPAGAKRSGQPASSEFCEPTARAEWFARHGGALAGGQSFRVEVVNDSDRTLVIEGLRVRHVEVLPAIRGVGQTVCPGGGGPFDTQYAVIDLDRRAQGFKYYDEAFKPTRAINFAPEPHEPLRFWVQAKAEAKRYRWTAVLEYSLDGQQFKVPIGDPRKPFEISGCSFRTGKCISRGASRSR